MNQYISFKIINDLKIGVCIAEKEYIPIDFFKTSFLEIQKKVASHQLTSMVFDKSKLTVFHQPSMEWYYTNWKKELLEIGLHRHYKILPPIPWFKQSVEAGKEEIKQNHPNFDFSVFHVSYVNSLDEVIETEKSLAFQ